MRTLIVEDDFTNRLLLQQLLKDYGQSHIAVNGQEAVEAMQLALEANDPYNLICLDIMMPKMNGQDTLKEIRRIEAKKGIARAECAKVIMLTALSDKTNVLEAIQHQCDCYLIKPCSKEKLLQELRNLKLNRPLGI